MMPNRDNSEENTVDCCYRRVSLKTGTFCIGLFQAILHACLLAFIISAAIDVTHDASNDSDFSHLDEKTKKGYLIVLSIAAVMYGLNIILAMMLAYGARKEKRALIKPWLYFAMVFVNFMIIFYVMAAVSSFKNDNPQMGAFMIFILISDAGNEFRGIVIVKRYLQKLKEAGSAIESA